MIFPDDPHVVGWGKNKRFVEALGQKLQVDTGPTHFLFPVGTMFWARVESIRPILDLELDWKDYPSEPLPYDGSILHALERLFSLVASARGGRSVLTNVPGVTR
jgi:lipopolysaccharide biosynthesis protein